MYTERLKYWDEIGLPYNKDDLDINVVCKRLMFASQIHNRLLMTVESIYFKEYLTSIDPEVATDFKKL